jgi:WD40 repeat protein
VGTIAFSSDGARILTSSSDGTVRTWDAATGVELARFECGATGRVGAVFSADNRKIATMMDNNRAAVWDSQSGPLLTRLNGTDINSLDFSPDGVLLVTACGDGKVRIWETEQGAELLALNGHRGRARSAEFLSGGASVASVGDEGEVLLWDTRRLAAFSLDRRAYLAAALAYGVGNRTPCEAKDLLLADAPEDLFKALMDNLSSRRQAGVWRSAQLLRS